MMNEFDYKEAYLCFPWVLKAKDGRVLWPGTRETRLALSIEEGSAEYEGNSLRFKPKLNGVEGLLIVEGCRPDPNEDTIELIKAALQCELSPVESYIQRIHEYWEKRIYGPEIYWEKTHKEDGLHMYKVDNGFRDSSAVRTLIDIKEAPLSYLPSIVHQYNEFLGIGQEEALNKIHKLTCLAKLVESRDVSLGDEGVLIEVEESYVTGYCLEEALRNLLQICEDKDVKKFMELYTPFGLGLGSGFDLDY